MNKKQMSHKNIELRVFVGFQINSELRMHLNQSLPWKQAKIHPSSTRELVEIHFHQKDYIGQFLSTNPIKLPEIKQIEMKIVQKLNSYCPQFASEKIRLLVFSQVFIS